MGVPSRMALKAAIFLATVGLVYSQSHCSAFDSDSNFGRDCTCGDKAFDSCEEPNTNDKFHVNTIDECKFQCDLFNSFGACDWFLFYQGGGMDENCHLFGPGKEGLSDFLNTCTVRGGALRNADDKCLEEVDYCDNTGICPGGCATCTDDPCNGYAETGTVVLKVTQVKKKGPFKCHSFLLSREAKSKTVRKKIFCWYHSQKHQ